MDPYTSLRSQCCGCGRSCQTPRPAVSPRPRPDASAYPQPIPAAGSQPTQNMNDTGFWPQNMNAGNNWSDTMSGSVSQPAQNMTGSGNWPQNMTAGNNWSDAMSGSVSQPAQNMTGSWPQNMTDSNNWPTVMPAYDCPQTAPGPLEQNHPIAMAYVPWQQWQTTYAPERGLAQGTIFPELDLPFNYGGCSR